MPLGKKKDKKKRKRKEKEKEGKLKCFALKPEHGPRDIWRKPLKPGALNLHWLGVADLVLATRVDGWSLASCRFWSFEIIRSSGLNLKSLWSKDPYDLVP